MTFDDLRLRRCPVCEAKPTDSIFAEQRIDESRLGEYSYASRKTPEFMSFRLVRCARCSTVYAPEIPEDEFLHSAYEEAAFDSADEAETAASSYATALRGYFPQAAPGGALEIGTGTGAFLAHLRRAGYEPVVGVEPSVAAIQAAVPALRPLIRNSMFDAADFDEESFALVCSFQTLEHVAEPRAVLEAAFRLLKPGGIAAFVTHDYEAWLNRLLGRRSPIIDIEHLQLFCPQAMRSLLARAGFTNIEITPIRNIYRVQYWLRLLPVPSALKAALSAIAGSTGLGALRVGARVGNILTVGHRPET